MISATAEPQPGEASPPPRRLRPGLWIAVVFVFAAQLGLLFWLGNPPAGKLTPTSPAPTIHVSSSGSEELLALMDPTLFVLPHRDNFSGAAWAKVPPQNFTPTNWSEPARPLQLLRDRLGATFSTFMQTNIPSRFHPSLSSGLDEITGPRTSLESISTPSTLRVEGDLAKLELQVPLHLPPQTNSDLLTNTVVQLLVNAKGYPFSPVVLSGSGSPIADAAALTFTKTVRFQPAQAAALGTVPPDKMTLGKLVFEWQTMPPLTTNAPLATP